MELVVEEALDLVENVTHLLRPTNNGFLTLRRI